MGEAPPEDPEERFEWIVERGRRLELLTEETWISDEVERLWDEIEDAGDRDSMYDPPEGCTRELYALFQYGVLFGMDLEAKQRRVENTNE